MKNYFFGFSEFPVSDLHSDWVCLGLHSGVIKDVKPFKSVIKVSLITQS